MGTSCVVVRVSTKLKDNQTTNGDGAKMLGVGGGVTIGVNIDGTHVKVGNAWSVKRCSSYLKKIWSGNAEAATTL